MTIKNKDIKEMDLNEMSEIIDQAFDDGNPDEDLSTEILKKIIQYDKTSDTFIFKNLLIIQTINRCFGKKDKLAECDHLGLSNQLCQLMELTGPIAGLSRKEIDGHKRDIQHKLYVEMFQVH